MAKYDVTYSCGHTGTVQLFGKLKTREWILDQEAMKLCPECWKEEQEKIRKEENEKSAQEAKEQGLPELIGTENQVAWANTIRMRMLKITEEEIAQEANRAYTSFWKAEGVTEQEKERILQAGTSIILQKKSASWWIDHRNYTSGNDILRLLIEEYWNQKKATFEPPAEVVEEINNEATIYPENPKTTTIAEIRPLEGKFEIEFPERRDDFRELVKKELNMFWSGQCWARKIIAKNGTVQDRAAEAGHRLLAAGFPIRIFDSDIRQKAIAGEYEAECTNWVQVRTDPESKYNGWFAINWSRDDDYYKAARRIPGSKWSNPSVVVPPEKFEEVLDFARIYNFKLSEMAQKLAETEKKKKEAALFVKVEDPVRKEQVITTGKPPVLEIPEEVDIDDELKD